MPILKKLFRNKDNAKPDEIDTANDVISSDNANNANGEDEELIAVISAAIAAFLQKPVSGFRVVSFKQRGNWSNFI